MGRVSCLGSTLGRYGYGGFFRLRPAEVCCCPKSSRLVALLVRPVRCAAQRPSAALALRSARDFPYRTVRACATVSKQNERAVDEDDEEDGGSIDTYCEVDLLSGLSVEQEGVVMAPKDGALRVVAGPGSGKTRVLTTRVANLLQQGMPPWQVLTITFTNKSARELKHRLTGMVGPQKAALIDTGTFHSVAQRLIRREIRRLPEEMRRGLTPDFTILDADESKNMLTAVLRELDPTIEKARSQARDFQVSNLKNASDWGLTGSKAEAQYRRARKTSSMKLQLGAVLDRYEAKLRNNNAMDFDDILPLAVAILKHCPEVLQRYQQRWHHVLVDEFQDTNAGQYEFVRLLTSHRGALFVVGDPDQSIYGWRGADVDNMVNNVGRDFPSVNTLQLRDNYRSTARICRAADAVIKLSDTSVVNRVPLRAMKTEGTDIHVIDGEDERAEAAQVVAAIKRLAALGRPLRDIAVLFRTNSQTRPLEEALVTAQVAYRLESGVKFWSRTEIKDCVAYLRLVVSSDDTLALLRVINVPARKIGPKTVDKLASWAEGQGCSLAQALLRDLDGSSEIVAELPSAKEMGVTKAARNGIAELREVVQMARCAVSRTRTANAVLETILERIRYFEWVTEGRCGEGDEEQRLLNVSYLIDRLKQLENDGVADFAEVAISGGIAVEENDEGTGEFEAGGSRHVLKRFLNEVALQTDEDVTDESGERGEGQVRLMTLHAAKGLEFPVVFITGCEMGLLPLSSWDGNSRAEEERRLFYVGVTRAQEQLFLSHARQRSRPGMIPDYDIQPSPFLLDIERAVGLQFLEDVATLAAAGDAKPEVQQQLPFCAGSHPNASLHLSNRRPSPVSIDDGARKGTERGSAPHRKEVRRPVASDYARETKEPPKVSQRRETRRPVASNYARQAHVSQNASPQRREVRRPVASDHARTSTEPENGYLRMGKESSRPATSERQPGSVPGLLENADFEVKTRLAFGSSSSRSWDELEEEFFAAERAEADLLSSGEGLDSLCAPLYFAAEEREDEGVREWTEEPTFTAPHESGLDSTSRVRSSRGGSLQRSSLSTPQRENVASRRGSPRVSSSPPQQNEEIEAGDEVLAESVPRNGIKEGAKGVTKQVSSSWEGSGCEEGAKGRGLSDKLGWASSEDTADGEVDQGQAGVGGGGSDQINGAKGGSNERGADGSATRGQRRGERLVGSPVFHIAAALSRRAERK